VNSRRVTIGLRAKTARAIAVVLGGSADSPIVVAKTEIKLVDPKIPETAQPYHVVMDLPWVESRKVVQSYVGAIEKIAAKALAGLMKEQQTNGMKVCGAGIVGSPDRDLARIGNPHIRAHAAEGILFRRVLDLAAEANGLQWRAFSDRQLGELTTSELGSTARTVKRTINDLGRNLPPPWRTDEKQAAMAAWMVLHGKRARRR
jgi:hypothetical protein